MSPEERRETIVAALLPLLAQHGGGVTTRQIAEAAGIAEGTIFRVFPDKRALFLAAAEETMNPPRGREELADALAAAVGLRARVVVTVERLVARMEKGMLVMMALRSVFMAEGPPDRDAGQPPGPPAFVVEANQQLLANLTDLLFTPHADELRVPPERAALVLRSLVFGAWHPGMPHGDAALTPEHVADVLLDGVAARSHPTPKDAPRC
jgi:AcrR family transcriptional regulator